jgi:hypothetical protein
VPQQTGQIAWFSAGHRRLAGRVEHRGHATAAA